MNLAQRIISKWESQTALADAIGITQTAVAYWAKVGRIPSKWHGEVLNAAARMGISLSAAELVEAPRQNSEGPLPEAMYEGDLSLGSDDMKIRAYVLDDGRRVISRNTATATLAKGTGGDFAAYVRPISEYLRAPLDEELVEFHLAGKTKRVYGITAESFLAICRAYVRARQEGGITTARQNEIADRASMFLAACATVGLIALIDEATGYQYARAEDALQVKLRAYLAEEMRAWEKTFPDELWVELGRLTGWEGTVQSRPRYWGHLVTELVYQYLDPDVTEWLKTNEPKPRHGRNWHQWLSEQYGLKKLIEHLWMLIGMARACEDIQGLKYQMALRFGRHPVQMTLYPRLPVAKVTKSAE